LIYDKVIGRWPGILSGLGVDDSFLRDKHGPCPFCGGKDRYRFSDCDGEGTYFCNQCGSGNGWMFVKKMFGCDFSGAAKKVESIIGNCNMTEIKTKKDPRIALKKIAQLAKDININGEITGYLNNRGLFKIPETLKEAKLWYWFEGIKVGPFATMIALVSDRSAKGVTYHLTYINKGVKAKVDSPRKIMTPIHKIHGCAVRLHSFEDKICIAEGIETALAAHEFSKLPAFAALNANGLANFEVPDGITQVSIYSDNDGSFCGQKSAFILAERLVKEGIEVIVKIPKKIDSDWLDIIETT